MSDSDVIDELFDGPIADPSEDVAEAAIVRFGEIQVRPERNVSRGGKLYPPDHPEVRRQAEEIKKRDHVPPVGLRPIEPVARPCGSDVCCSRERLEDGVPSHLYELVYGYVRYVAAHVVLGRTHLRAEQPNVECVISDTITDAEALERNVAENLVRASQTDHEFARCMRLVRDATGKNAQEIARAVGARSAHDVETAIRIVDRCPEDVVEEWGRNPRRELKRVISRISWIDPSENLPTEERHERMRAQWRAEVEALERDGEVEPQTFREQRGGRGEGRRVASRALLERTLGRVDLATEVYDHKEGGYRAIASDGEREAVRAALRFAADPSGTDPPVR